MTAFILALSIGLVALAAGLLGFLVPAAAWRAATRPRSRLAHQASTCGALLFAGLGWFGLCLVAFNASEIAIGLRSLSWPAQPATVRESRLVAFSQLRSTAPAYRPEATYAYVVAGRDYTGTRLDFGSRALPDRAAAEAELATRLAPGAALVVHVDPRNPASAVVTPGPSAFAAIQGALGLAFIAVSIWQLRALATDWSGARAAGPAKAPYVVHRRR